MDAREKSLRSAVRFAARLKAARREAGLTQEELVARADCAPITLSKLETGANKPTYEIFVALAYALDVSPNYLVGWDAPESRGMPRNQVLLNRLTLVAEDLPDDWLEILIEIARKAPRPQRA